MKKTRFRIKSSDTIKGHLYNSEGKVIETIYDSGFTRLIDVKNALLNKCCNPSRKTTFSVYNEDEQTYWRNN